MQTKVLSLIDIAKFKKDILWGKYYYSLIDSGNLIDWIIYSYYQQSIDLIEIHSIEHKSLEFLNKFTHDFALKENVRYFLRELDESTQATDIEYMNQCGFKRYNRNYCYEYDSKKIDKHNNSLQLYCKELEKQDIAKLIDIDISAQILDYRDLLHKNDKFFKRNQENIFVFSATSDIDKVCGFAFKRELDNGSTFEFIVSPKQSDLLEDCIQSFAEHYIYFEKTSSSFRFIINETHKPALEEIQKKFPLIWSTQLLILEGAPREKSKQTNPGLAFTQATAPSQAQLTQSNT